ncbi:MAG: divergent polysaccharide deacetylase family protein, partial [Geopsychrobacter sp.]|nr:divergent polysaccharide deacetylase family protein [Geopsychrobacter sp.]
MARKKQSSKSTPKKKSTVKKTGLKGAVIALVSGTLVLVALIVYFSMQGQPPVKQQSTLRKISISTYADVSRLVEDELLSSEHSSGWQRLESGGLVRLQMYGDYPESLRLMELATRIALTDSPAQLDLAPRKGLVRVYWLGELRMELHYKAPEKLSSQRPKIAIIMDDMGRSLRDFDELMALGLPVTPAILPQTSFATRGARVLKENDHEYMIHLPMEPKKYPAISPGPNALLLDLSRDELQSRVAQYFQKVPGAVGGNNHMGSRFTENRPAMRAVLEGLKTAGLFFVDSRTIGDSVAFDEARRMGLETAQRDIFLDNQENTTYIGRQLRKMVKIAEEKGTAIAICHPYPQTFAALRENH